VTRRRSSCYCYSHSCPRSSQCRRIAISHAVNFYQLKSRNRKVDSINPYDFMLSPWTIGILWFELAVHSQMKRR
jgi:hypothetical protein